MIDAINQIRQELVDAFSPHWALNDPAHQQEHFEDVFKTAMYINKDQHYFFDPVHILFAAYLHDLFAWSRKNHHDLSCEFVRDTDHPLILKYLPSQNERDVVAYACHEHRASYKGTFYSAFTAMINAADRGFPNDVPAMVERSRKYWLAKWPEMSEDERMAGVIQHIKDKFGHGGYARYPDVYLRTFGGQVNEMKDKIAKL